MLNNLPRKNLLAMLISSALLMTGCGGGGGTTAPGTNNTDDQTGGRGTDNPGNTGDDSVIPINPFSGSSNISGSISLSSLGGSDADSLENGSIPDAKITRSGKRVFANVTDNAIIKLFSVGSNGELEETGIECNFSTEDAANGNPKYTCDGVADGKNYVIKYVRILEGNRALEMRVNVRVPEGSDEVPADAVSPQSTVVADTIINAILSATEGKEIDQEIIDDIIVSVKEVVENLVATGAVQVPSMLVEAPKDDEGNFITNVSDLESEEDVTFGDNESLESAAGTLLSNQEVSAEVDAVKVEIEIREFAQVDIAGDEGKRDLIKKIFEKLLDGDGDVPRFMIDFFAEQFEDGSTVNIARLFDAIYAGMAVNHQLVDFSLDDFGITPETATQNLQDTLNDIYALLSLKESHSLSEEEKRELADIPGIIPAIFPAGTTITPDTVLNIPQSIVYTIFIADKYIPEVIEDETGFKEDDFISVGSEGGETSGPVEVEFEHLVDFDPMHFDPSGDNPGLMQLFGFFEEDYLNSLAGIDIGRLDIHPDTVWIEDQQNNDLNNDQAGILNGPTGREYDSLRANVCISDLSAMAGLFGAEEQESEFDVELSYPTRSGGRGTVTLLNEHDLHFGSGSDIDFPNGGEDGTDDRQEPNERGGPEFESCFTLDPWASAQQSQSTDGYFQPSLDDIVSDFTSGQYNISVRNSAGVVVAEREFKRKVIVGMRNASPQLISPNGRPDWPAECNGTPTCDAFEKRQLEFEERGGNTTFALNVDTDEDGINDRAEVTMKWKEPSNLELPEGIRIAYSMDVVLNKFSDSGYRWENIYSSHQDDKLLFGRSFTLPTLLEKLEVVDGQYHVNVCAEFIDTENGEFIGRGGCGFAEFNVGEPLDLNAEFRIEGKAPAGLDSNWKVAVITEEYQPPQDQLGTPTAPNVTTKAISDIDEDGNYSFTPTLGDFLNGSRSSHTSVILFRDDNDDGQLQNSPFAEDNQHEPIYWPNWEDNVRFESWDGILRVVSEHNEDGEYHREEIIVTGGETIKGPDFSYLSDEDWFQRKVNENLGDNGGDNVGDNGENPDDKPPVNPEITDPGDNGTEFDPLDPNGSTF